MARVRYLKEIAALFATYFQILSFHFFQRNGSCASSQTQSLRSHSTMAMLIFGAQLIPYTLCFWISWYCTRWLWLFLYTAASLWENDYARTMCKSMPVVFRRAQTHGVALALGSQSYWPARNEYIYVWIMCLPISSVCLRCRKCTLRRWPHASKASVRWGMIAFLICPCHIHCGDAFAKNHALWPWLGHQSLCIVCLWLQRKHTSVLDLWIHGHCQCKWLDL